MTTGFKEFFCENNFKKSYLTYFHEFFSQMNSKTVAPLTVPQCDDFTNLLSLEKNSVKMNSKIFQKLPV